MSNVQTQIDRIKGNVTAALTALTDKGVDIPDNANSDDLAALIRAIQSGTDFAAIIVAEGDNDATVTCAMGDEIYSATIMDGQASFLVTAPGTWTLTLSEDGNTVTKTAEITHHLQIVYVDLYLARVYGISRDITAASPAWTRTDRAVGMTATASIGASAGASDFDSVMPWAGMTRRTLPTGDVMVRIPKFYYQRYRDGNVEHIRIAEHDIPGFALHPLFNHGGVESECAYVGAYETSNNNKSISGASPTVSATRATFRTNTRSKAPGWSIIDIAAVSAIQMLFLVEFATNNAQGAIGRGYCDGNTAPINSGSCDSVPNLTGRPSGTDGKTGVVYRGIENFWGNVWEWVDGVNIRNNIYYVCNDIPTYGDNTTIGYAVLSFNGVKEWAASYITQEGLDAGNNPHVMLPFAADEGSETTFQCDACWANTGTGHTVLFSGGSREAGSFAGLFAAVWDSSSVVARADVGSRLLYIPSEEVIS